MGCGLWVVGWGLGAGGWGLGAGGWDSWEVLGVWGSVLPGVWLSLGSKRECCLAILVDDIMSDQSVRLEKQNLRRWVTCIALVLMFAWRCCATPLSHSCALTMGNVLRCWGLNQQGQLGIGMDVLSYNSNGMQFTATPMDVVGLGGAVLSFALGGTFSCALLIAGGVKCWGQNGGFGFLGIGNEVEKMATPTNVLGLSTGVVSLVAKETSACALLSAGEVQCWGYVGNSVALSPRRFTGFSSTVVSIAVGFVVLDSGYITCLWDMIVYVEKYCPTNIQVVSIVQSSEHACLLTTSNGLYCWGGNSGGKIGDGTTQDRSSPVAVLGMGSGVTSYALSAIATCAVVTGGRLKCWGGNGCGVLGVEELRKVDIFGMPLSCGSIAIFNKLIPTDVVGLSSGVESVAMGWGHTCALLIGGEVSCWGSSQSGQTGIADTLFAPSTYVNGLVASSIWQLPCSPNINTFGFAIALSDRVPGKPSVSVTLNFTPSRNIPQGSRMTLTYPTGFFMSSVTPSATAGSSSLASFEATCSPTTANAVIITTRGTFITAAAFTVTLKGFTMGPLTQGAVGVSIRMACSASLSVSSGSLMCPAGSFWNSAACALCPLGQFQDVSGFETRCKLCSSGTYNLKNGSTSSSACSLCPSGSYQPFEGQSFCILCGQGNISAAGSSICSAPGHELIILKMVGTVDDFLDGSDQRRTFISGLAAILLIPERQIVIISVTSGSIVVQPAFLSIAESSASPVEAVFRLKEAAAAGRLESLAVFDLSIGGRSVNLPSKDSSAVGLSVPLIAGLSATIFLILAVACLAWWKKRQTRIFASLSAVITPYNISELDKDIPIILNTLESDSRISGARNLAGAPKDIKTGKFQNAALGLKLFLKVSVNWSEFECCSVDGLLREIDLLRDCPECALVQSEVLEVVRGTNDAYCTLKLKDALLRLRGARSVAPQDKDAVQKALADVDILRKKISDSAGWYYGCKSAAKVDWPDDCEHMKKPFGRFKQPLCSSCRKYCLDHTTISQDMDYILNQPSAEESFWNGIRDKGRAGMRLSDFANSAVMQQLSALDPSGGAMLSMAEIASLRFYTSHSFESINAPLRDQERTVPHPLPALTTCIQSGLKKLRALGASDASSRNTIILWRGFYDMHITGDFLANGGTELAPMSTTPDVRVAVQYAINKPEKDLAPSLLFRIVTHNNLQRGADVRWLSMFPEEEETLFPPLTYLQATGKTHVLQHCKAEGTGPNSSSNQSAAEEQRGFHITIVEVTATLP